jgi:PMR5 N terminal Domain
VPRPIQERQHRNVPIASHAPEAIINKPNSSLPQSLSPLPHPVKFLDQKETTLTLKQTADPAQLSPSLSRCLVSMRMPRRKPSFLFATNSTASVRKPNHSELRRAAALIFSAILLGTLLYSADNVRFITIHSQINRSSPLHLNSRQTAANHTAELSDPVLGGLQSAGDSFDGAKKRVLNVYGRRERKDKEKCNLFDGEWIYEEEEDKARRYPLYREEECVFLTEQVTCMRNGRKDDRYQRWRWQPHSCSLPRYVR